MSVDPAPVHKALDEVVTRAGAELAGLHRKLDATIDDRDGAEQELAAVIKYAEALETALDRLHETVAGMFGHGQVARHCMAYRCREMTAALAEGGGAWEQARIARARAYRSG